MSPSLGLSDVFSHDYTRVMSFGKECHRNEVLLLSCFFKKILNELSVLFMYLHASSLSDILFANVLKVYFSYIININTINPLKKQTENTFWLTQ